MHARGLRVCLETNAQKSGGANTRDGTLRWVSRASISRPKVFFVCGPSTQSRCRFRLLVVCDTAHLARQGSKGFSSRDFFSSATGARSPVTLNASRVQDHPGRTGPRRLQGLRSSSEHSLTSREIFSMVRLLLPPLYSFFATRCSYASIASMRSKRGG